MKIRLMVIACLILIFLGACQSLIPTPTVTPTATLTNTPSPTPTTAPTSTQTPIPTATRELTLEEKFGHLVPENEKGVLYPEVFTTDPLLPSGTKLTAMQFRSTGESKREPTSLGEVAMVHLVFRDNDGVLQDIWMMFAGYSFGENNDGTNVLHIDPGGGGDQIRWDKPEELLKLVCPGTYFSVTVAWQKGNQEKIREECWPEPYKVCNELQQEAYRRIAEDSDDLKLLIEGNKMESSTFRLVPESFKILESTLCPQ